MPNPFKDWARMNRANKEYLESQGRPSGFLGQLADIPDRMHEAADDTEIGIKLMRHHQLTNGAGIRGVALIDGAWHVGTYASTSPVFRIRARIEREDGLEAYVTTFDSVVAPLHAARMQQGARIAVAVDPANPAEIAIDWLRTGRLTPPARNSQESGPRGTDPPG